MCNLHSSIWPSLLLEPINLSLMKYIFSNMQRPSAKYSLWLRNWDNIIICCKQLSTNLSKSRSTNH
jgi:hypothetical protein